MRPSTVRMCKAFSSSIDWPGRISGGSDVTPRSRLLRASPLSTEVDGVARVVWLCSSFWPLAIGEDRRLMHGFALHRPVEDVSNGRRQRPSSNTRTTT